MAESIEKKIFKDIETVLTTLVPTTLGTVKFGTFEPSNVTLPAAGIIPGDDDPNHTPGALWHGMAVIIRVVAGESDDQQAGYVLLDVVPVIETKIVEDVKRGGNAQDTRYAGKRWLFNDKDYPSAGVDISYRVDFKTKITDPTAIP